MPFPILDVRKEGARSKLALGVSLPSSPPWADPTMAGIEYGAVPVVQASPTESSSTSSDSVQTDFSPASSMTSLSTLNYNEFLPGEDTQGSHIAGTHFGSTSHIIECPSCQTPFRGKHRKANMKRHFKITHLKVYLPCPYNGCRKLYTRLEYLQKHESQCHREMIP
ncbi:hypothetical protein MMC20_004643 [Loxospora ochrophaea]|nr:hypothetical protein [Loxospora ochrophaea]